MRDLRACSSVFPGASRDSLRRCQDADGLEVDVIIELRDGRWASIEVKLGENEVPDGIANLNRLRKKTQAIPAARNKEPSFMVVVTAASPFARYGRENDATCFPPPRCLRARNLTGGLHGRIIHCKYIANFMKGVADARH